MIQILRRRFIITAMLAISVLLLVLLGVINTGNIIVNNQRTNQVLNNLIESYGTILAHRGCYENVAANSSVTYYG